MARGMNGVRGPSLQSSGAAGTATRAGLSLPGSQLSPLLLSGMEAASQQPEPAGHEGGLA